MTKLSMSEEEMLKRKYIRPYEKRIADLEKENAELKKVCDETQELLDKQIEATYKLDKENAELKDEWQEQVQKATDEGYVRTLQTIQLTKAKVFIRSLKSLIEDVCDINYLSKDNTRLLVEAEQFLSEVE